MPTYEYECTACGHKFERFQSMSEEPVKKCPQCKGAVQRAVGGGMAVILKGDARQSEGACSLEKTGRTCCGRDERCGAQTCGRKG